ncbi:MAG: hypothetical protein BA864_06875 [Desulfuromonadales bacterium C00003093]|nr:MAG: hypothetical protein BA864_06875 [Desulfuromonadales bacterium C00003093]
MPDVKQLNVRISCKLHRMIEATDRSKQSVVTDALELYFGGVPKQDDSGNIAVCAQQLAEKDRQIAELHVMVQTSINHQQKLLPPPTREYWWQIWKRKE